MNKQALLLYPNQLFAADSLPKEIDEVVLVEEPLFFGTDKQYRSYMHKQKLIFHRSTMRRYMEEELWPVGYQVDYIEMHRLTETGDIIEKLKDFEKIYFFELNDDVLRRRLVSAISSHPEGPEYEVLKSPSFYLSNQECEKFFANKAKSKFSDFYQWQRERFNILIDPKTYKPLEGKWNFEAKKRKRLPKNHDLPTFQVFGSNNYVEEAKKYVEQNFSENPGSVKDFPWPTNRKEAETWFNEFLKNRLENFDLYKDAIDGDSPWAYHSGISPMLNVGLLEPEFVIKSTVEQVEKGVSVETVESFVRQILGWREYMRALYYKYNVGIRTSNNYGHSRRMTADWYKGTTGIPPVDDVIKKVQSRAYIQQNERFMIIGNIMFLCEFHPDDIYRWFIELLIDGYDWNMVPNVYGVSQGGEIGNESLSHPMISSSNYILSMSHYEKGDWCDIWDGLYWGSIEKNREKFSKNPAMSMAVKKLDKMNSNRKRVIGYRADDFLNEKTVIE